MLMYLGDLMEDATDFSWANAKASHAVLLCEMERVSVTCRDTSRIDKIRRDTPRNTQHPTNKIELGVRIQLVCPGFARPVKVACVPTTNITRL